MGNGWKLRLVYPHYDAIFSWEIHGKYMGNTWEIHGKYMGNTWEIYGNSPLEPILSPVLFDCIQSCQGRKTPQTPRWMSPKLEASSGAQMLLIQSLVAR